MIFISGSSEILDFGTYPVFSRKISASTTQSRESVFLIFSFLELEEYLLFSKSFPFPIPFPFNSPPHNPLLHPQALPPHHATSPLPHTSFILIHTIPPPHPTLGMLLLAKENTSSPTWQAPIGQGRHLILPFAIKPLTII